MADKLGRYVIMGVLQKVNMISVWRLTKILFIVDKRSDLMAFNWSSKWYSPTTCDVKEHLEELIGEELVGYKLCPPYYLLALNKVKLPKDVERVVEGVEKLAKLSPLKLLELVAELKGVERRCWECELEELLIEVQKGDKCAAKELMERILERYRKAIMVLPFLYVNDLEGALLNAIDKMDSSKVLFSILVLLENLERAVEEGDVEEIIMLREKILSTLKFYLGIKATPENLLIP